MSEYTPEPCECRVFATMVEGLDEPLDYRIERCPTHAAAPDLLAALENLLASPYLTFGESAVSVPPGIVRARAAIAKAKGDEPFESDYDEMRRLQAKGDVDD